jgi:hypothetical protein
MRQVHAEVMKPDLLARDVAVSLAAKQLKPVFRTFAALTPTPVVADSRTTPSGDLHTRADIRDVWNGYL